MPSRTKNGGISSRMGENFYEQIEKIKDGRLKNGKSKDRISTVRITNMIIRHKLWANISGDIVNADQKEIDQFGV